MDSNRVPAKGGSHTFRLLLMVVVIILLLGLVNSVAFGLKNVSGVGGFYNWLGEALNVDNQSDTTAPLKETYKVVDEESATIAVVESTSPSVVSVLEKSVSYNLFNGPQLQESSIGTGFAVAKDIVVSNRHVVSDTDATYSVVDSDGDKLDVVDIYRDPLNDLALLKISDGDFTPIELGDSDVVRVGQTVIAIGNALGRFSNSVTKGIISGVGRGITASGSISQFQEEIENVLQTDAALNPGNSGGPLLNIAGQVIGVNVAVGVQTENIGFAIPVNTVKELISDYQSGVDRRKPFLGIEYVVITPEFAQNSDLPEGVLVRSVVSDSAADEAGVKINDVITAIDQTNISDSTSLASIIKGYKVNDKVKLSVWRNGQTLELTAQLKASE